MSFKAFLKQSAILPENKKIAISKRFLDEKGKPMPWELRALTEKENAAIKDSCTSKANFKGRETTKFNGSLYSARLCTATVVYPDLKDAELQASYGVVGEEALLAEMLLPGEYSALAEIAQEINGFDLERLEKDVESVKNS